MRRRIRKKWIRKVVGPLLGAALLWYFLYHMIQGDRGWFSMLRVQSEIKTAEKTLSTLRETREEIEHRTRLLRDQSIDPDLLDEQARQQLNLSKPNEIIILIPKEEKPQPPSSR